MMNDIIWQKPDPPPNALHTAFTYARETLFWASKSRGARHTFNYDLISSLNPDAQVSTVWRIPTGPKHENLHGYHPKGKPLKLAARRIQVTERGSLLREVSKQFWNNAFGQVLYNFPANSPNSFGIHSVVEKLSERKIASKIGRSGKGISCEEQDKGLTRDARGRTEQEHTCVKGTIARYAFSCGCSIFFGSPRVWRVA